MSFKRHPYAIAWEKWLESEDGKKCLSPLPTSEIYLNNRLHYAFDAGIRAAEAYLEEKKK